ncbi:MAG: type I polyketide synthase, partial [Solirubrobacteraceae bacterium]
SLAEQDLERHLRRFDGRLSIAAVNGPRSIAVAGDTDALEELEAACRGEEVRVRRLPVSYAAHSAHVESVREVLLHGLAGVEPRAGEIPFHSAVTGGVLPGSSLDAEYWYRNLREPVRFDRAVATLLGEGRRGFVEISPHPVLGVGVSEAGDHARLDPGELAVIGSIERDAGDGPRFAQSLAEAFVAGIEIDWRTVLAGQQSAFARLPTYAFQRKRHWVLPSAAVADAGPGGLRRSEHPFLTTAVRLAGGRGWLFTGRIDLGSHPWLADHALMGVVLLPGTAFVELALWAGRQVGADTLCELALQRPLVLEEDEPASLQLQLGDPDQTGSRALSIHSCTQARLDESADAEQDWICHAEGMLQGGVPASAPESRAASMPGAPLQRPGGVKWPSAGAEPLSAELLYARGAELGADFGPAFRGLEAVWRSEGEALAEIALADAQADECESFLIHPALLDAALHAARVLDDPSGVESHEAQSFHLPFSWTGVRLHRRGGRSLRARVRRVDHGAVSLELFDTSGEPTISVETLVSRPITASQLHGARRSLHDSLLRVRWRAPSSAGRLAGSLAGPWAVLGRGGSDLTDAIERAGHDTVACEHVEALIETLDAGGAAPAVVLLDCGVGDAEPSELVAAAHACTRDALEALRAWLAEERLAASRLVVLTRGAIAVAGGERPGGLSQAPIWGLVRSAQSEHPGSLAIVDLDDEPGSVDALAAALHTGESQLAIRAGAAFVPRLARSGRPERAEVERAEVERAEHHGSGESIWSACGSGSVLITGGTGDIGSFVASHLVAQHGIRNLILASRRGLEAPGARRLQDQLSGMGARVEVHACDVADPEQLRALLGQIPRERPLVGVVHAAAVLADGVLASLTREQLAQALAPKLDAAWHLHTLTAELELRAFVLFSSVMGILGGPGQANYAAANAFLDALAAHRRASGLPAVSLAWGGWEATGVVTRMRDADLARTSRLGIGAVSTQDGLSLLDAALEADEALIVPLRLNRAALRAQVQSAGGLSPLLADLLAVHDSTAGERGCELAGVLAATPAEDRESVALEAVRAEVASILGHRSAQAVPPKSSFKQLGFDSLAAVDLRNRMSRATGLRLPSTLVFDHPSSIALARHILERLSAQHGAAEPEQDDTAISRRLSSIPPERLRDAGLLDPLLALAAALDAEGLDAADGDGRSGASEISTATAERASPIDAMDAEELVRRAMEGSCTAGLTEVPR